MEKTVKTICFLIKKYSVLAFISSATDIPAENTASKPKRFNNKKIDKILLSMVNHQLLKKFFLSLLNNFLVFKKINVYYKDSFFKKNFNKYLRLTL